MDCPTGQIKDAGLCYKVCENKSTGIGPVCWGLPPTGWVECGMGAAKDSKACASQVWDQVTSIGGVALNVATLGSASAITKAVQAGKNADRILDIKKKFEDLKKLLEGADKFKGLVDKYASAAGDVGSEVKSAQAVSSIDTTKVTEEEMVKLAADIAAIADPTGIAGTVAAYSFSKCSKIIL